MDRKEAIDLALNLFRKDLDKNDVVKTLIESNIPESTAYRYAKKALDQYEWEDDKDDEPKKNLQLNALNTIYKSMNGQKQTRKQNWQLNMPTYTSQTKRG